MNEASAIARYATRCKACAAFVEVGSAIFKWNERWVCAACNDRYERLEIEGNRKWVDELFAAVPKEHRSRIRKALAVAFHPDHGGDEAIMREINDAFDRIERSGL